MSDKANCPTFLLLPHGDIQHRELLWSECFSPPVSEQTGQAVESSCAASAQPSYDIVFLETIADCINLGLCPQDASLHIWMPAKNPRMLDPCFPDNPSHRIKYHYFLQWLTELREACLLLGYKGYYGQWWSLCRWSEEGARHLQTPV